MTDTTVTHQLKIAKNIFRSYDIRGIVGEELTVETVYWLGRAIAKRLCDLDETQIAAGCDGRLSSPELYVALCSGLSEGGINVIALHAVPTPLVYFASCIDGVGNGVMLTGSHNPKEYNGLKIVIQNNTLKNHELMALYHSIEQHDFSQGFAAITGKNIQQDYIHKITSSIKLHRPLKIVIDGGNSIAGPIAKNLYRALGCEVISLFEEVDGHFPNHHPDPGQLENLVDLQHAVLENKADIGLAFDGDGDRLGVVSCDGTIIFPDKLLMLFAKDVLKKQSGTIIFDVKCSSWLRRIILEAGGQPLLWNTGHALIKAKCKESNALLAGEMSGHFFFNDRWYGFDDALYAGARLLEILAEGTCCATELFSALPKTYATAEINIPYPDEEKFYFIQNFIDHADFPDAEKITLDGLRVEYPDGFGLVRASNTTPNLVLRFEGDTPESLERIKSKFYEELDKYITS